MSDFWPFVSGLLIGAVLAVVALANVIADEKSEDIERGYFTSGENLYRIEQVRP